MGWGDLCKKIQKDKFLYDPRKVNFTVWKTSFIHP